MPVSASGDEIRAWPDDTWARTEAAALLAGGEGRPLAERSVVGEGFAPAPLTELRELTTTGVFLDDICRCLGSLTVALLDGDGEFIGGGSFHGGTDIAWEWSRFRNNLEVAAPGRLLDFLARHSTYRRA
ncbi:hypothetical protein [Streptomyces sp. R41]|uniref:SUKH-3 domain containing protein n=1 Tax=Streptomyces sp. R41 TaxID=3238632 RepID=A0AB39RQ89_9ACTN